jgi:hypothetical protein
MRNNYLLFDCCACPSFVLRVFGLGVRAFCLPLSRITEDQSPEPLYGAFIYCVVNGWKWLVESTDKEKVYHQAKESFYNHTHFCPTCRYDISPEISLQKITALLK